MRVRVYIYPLFLALLMFALQGCWREGLLSLRGEVNPGKAKTLVDGETVVISDGATDVSIDTTYFEFEYENDVEQESVDEDTANITEGDESEECRPTDRIESEAILSAPRLVRIIPQELNYNRKYTLCLSGIRAIDKTEFRAMKLTFTTERGSFPFVTGTSPDDGAIVVSVDVVLQANFSEPMDGSTINGDTFLLESDAGFVSGTVAYTNPATFTPTAPLDYCVDYTATLTSDITDVDQNPIDEYSWNFLTEAELWSKNYQAASNDRSYTVQQTSDCGYIVGGESGPNWWIVKLFSDGSIEWQKTYGFNRAYSIRELSNGGYITTGAFGGNIWVAELDADGEVLKQKQYGGGSAEEGFSIKETSDGEYIVVGYTRSFDGGDKEMWVLKLRSDLSVHYQNYYQWDNVAESTEEAYDVIETSAGNFMVVGKLTYPGTDSDVWVLMLEPDLDVIWQKTYGSAVPPVFDGWDLATSVQETSDGYFLVAGLTGSFGAGVYDYWVLKLDSGGNIIWDKVYGGGDWDEAWAAYETPDGDYIVAGYAYSFGNGDGWLLKLNSANGEIRWQKAYGTPGDTERLQAMALTSDQGYVASGDSDNFDDFWVLKTDSNGNIGDSCAIISNTSVTPGSTSVSVNSPPVNVVATSVVAVDTSVPVVETSATVTTDCSEP